MIEHQRGLEIQNCIEWIERELGPEVSWTFCKIMSEHHAQKPYGRGYAVTLNGQDNVGAPTTVFEKANDFRTATERAIFRYKRRRQP